MEIKANIFVEAFIVSNPLAKMNQYIAEVNKRSNCNILYYWKVYLSLALMAKCFDLGIPAISAPSERVFLRSKTIIGSQRYSPSATTIEYLLCVKE